MAGPKLLVTGCRGRLGRDLVHFLGLDFEVIGVGRSDFDIRDEKAVGSFLRRVRPDVVLHAAAYVDVDGAESDRELAESVNVDGTANMARASREVGARMIYFSTDYVFDGAKKSPYIEADPPNPLSVYGRTKLAGERQTEVHAGGYAVLRVARLYGLAGPNFVLATVKAGAEQIRRRNAGEKVTPIRAVDDRIGSPTWTADIAVQTKVVIENELTGMFHVTAEGEASWYRLARDIFEILEWDVAVEACPASEQARPAPRPARSSLENAALKSLGLNFMRGYRVALSEFLLTNKERITGGL
jgi:dTDP-4-dehydrorhamnose reductase